MGERRDGCRDCATIGVGARSIGLSIRLAGSLIRLSIGSSTRGKNDSNTSAPNEADRSVRSSHCRTSCSAVHSVFPSSESAADSAGTERLAHASPVFGTMLRTAAPVSAVRIFTTRAMSETTSRYLPFPEKRSAPIGTDSCSRYLGLAAATTSAFAACSPCG